ncbi:MAG: hypothetical protein LCH84_08870 [Gemmatimonadetes bacterium]|nr:hypothetical protein [Gemmatimonadota bacterium]
MPLPVQSHVWKDNRALLLVHGIGNAKPGDYQDLVQAVRTALGSEADGIAIYQLFYDQVNDWFAAKNNLGALFAQALDAVADQIDDEVLGPVLADVLGDVLWPVLVADARAAVREAYLLQLKQIVSDGVAAGIPAAHQRLSIICHSLGCFHTYETLHHAAVTKSAMLQPATHGVRFENVVFMASPVQLIRTVAMKLGSLVPNRRTLYTGRDEALSIPSQVKTLGGTVTSVQRWISITGALDPVGGHFFRSKADWAYMDVPGTSEALIDAQSALNISTKAQLVATLKASLRDHEAPVITPQNPHSWTAYVERNTDKLKGWLT